jgi:hypothetical protein
VIAQVKQAVGVQVKQLAPKVNDVQVKHFPVLASK